MTSSSPKVRDACEHCHKRKIRCLLEPGGTACQNCLLSGNSCLFAPRAKAGRPRKIVTHRRQRWKAPWAEMRERTPPTQSSAVSRHNRSSSDSSTMIAMEPLDFTSAGFQDFWEQQKLPDEFHELKRDEFYSPNLESSMQKDLDPPEAKTLQRAEVAGPDQGFGILTPSGTPPFFQAFAARSTHESLDFDTALKLCGDLDRSYRNLRDGISSSSEVEAAIRIVEYTCTTAQTTTSSSSSEKASTALILAAIYKVFDICETLLRQWLNVESNEDALERLCRIKRVDLALLQSYIFLRQTGRPEALKKVSEIHTWVEDALRQRHYQMIW